MEQHRRPTVFTAVAALGLLIFMGATLFVCQGLETPTYDEPLNIAAGLLILNKGDYDLQVTDPPLGKMWMAFLLARVGAKLPEGIARPEPGKPYTTGYPQAVVYGNVVDHRLLMTLARLPQIILTLLLGVMVFAVCGLRWGWSAGLFALTIFSFEPTFLAHGRYATTDMMATFTFAAACIACEAFVARPSNPRLALAGLSVGTALASKYSNLPLVAALPLSAYLHTDSLRRVRNFLPVLLIAGVVLWLVYLPSLIAGTSQSWFTGIRNLLPYYMYGFPSYLMGKVSTASSPLYVPTVLAVKLTTGFLSALAVSFWVLRRTRPLLTLVVPGIIFLLAALLGKLGVGVRHLMPLLPLLIVMIAAAFAKAAPRLKLAMLLLALLHAGESLAAAPHHAGFFNWPSGGMSNGHRILLDSNIDMGQDLRRLAPWLREKGYPARVCLAYHGVADPRREGIEPLPLPLDDEVRRSGIPDCVAVVSVNLVYDLYSGFLYHGTRRWLREGYQPVGVVGTSLWVYDLRKSQQASSSTLSDSRGRSQAEQPR